MNKQTKIMISLLAIFIVGMTLGNAFAGSEDMVTFKSSSANDQYNKMRDVGSITPGYSDSIDVTVTKGGNTYHGVAFAIQNDHSIRCEVRKALPNGERLTANETMYIP